MDDASLKQRLSEGCSIARLAVELGVPASTLGDRIRRAGLIDPGLAIAVREPLGRPQLEELIDRGLSIREIASELGRSAGSVSYWLRKHGLKTRPRRYTRDDPRDEIERECRVHGMSRYRRVARRFRCVQCGRDAVAKRRRAVKAALVSEAGGCCVLCGYGRFQGALQFHHVDPRDKAFQISFNGVPRRPEILRQEAQKCVLLCANCHAEVEGGVVEIPSVRR